MPTVSATDLVVDVAEPQPARRRGVIAVALSVGFFVLAAPGSAWAQPAVLGGTGLIDETVEPVAETVNTVTKVLKPVRKAAKPVTDTVTAVVDPVTETVEEVAKPVTDTVKTVTKPVTDTVKQVTTTVVDVITDDNEPTGTDPTSRTPIGDPSGNTDTEAAPARRGAAPRTAADAPPASSTRARTSGRASPTAVDAALARRQLGAEATAVSDVGRSAPAQRAAPSVVEEIRRGVEGAVEAFRFPLLLAAVVLLFLAIQRRLDARDPKLADAEGEQELTFA